MTDFVLMKDSSQAPSLQQAQQFVADGVRVWGIYLGGRTPHVYTRAEVDAMKQGGIQRFVGFWVGPLRKYGQPFNYNLGSSEGREAVQEAQALGLLPSELMICPDIEDNANGQDVDDYCRGFKDSVRSFWPADLAGYGNPGTINSGSFNGYDDVIIADYLTPPATSPYDPRLPVTGWQGQRGVQSVGTHTEHGMGVDTSYLDPSFLGALAPAQPTPPPTEVARGDGTVLIAVTVSTGPDGNGQTETTYPWETFVAATAHSAIFDLDKTWKPGVAQATPYNDMILVTLYQGPPNSPDEIVWLSVRDTATPPPSNAVPAHTHTFSGTLSGSTGEPQ